MTKKQQVEFFLKQNFLVTYLWIEKSSIKTATVTLLNDKPWNYNMNYYGIILVYIIVPWINAVSQIVPLIRKKNPLWVPDLYIRLLNVHYILYTNIICRVDANFNSDWLKCFELNCFCLLAGKPSEQMWEKSKRIYNWYHKNFLWNS